MALYQNGTLINGVALPADISAEQINFDDTTSQLGATDVQGAIDALNSDLTQFSDNFKLNSLPYIYFSSSINGKAFEIRLGTDANNYMGIYITTTSIFFQQVQNGTATNVWTK